MWALSVKHQNNNWFTLTALFFIWGTLKYTFCVLTLWRSRLTTLFLGGCLLISLLWSQYLKSSRCNYSLIFRPLISSGGKDLAQLAARAHLVSLDCWTGDLPFAGLLLYALDQHVNIFQFDAAQTALDFTSERHANLKPRVKFYLLSEPGLGWFPSIMSLQISM